MENVINTLNEWIPVFLPILGIFLGVSIAIALMEKVGGAILKASKIYRDEPYSSSQTELVDSLDEKPKRSFNHDFEEEKPKRHFEPAYMLGDDGELLEVIDDKPKRGTGYDG